jgi:hypothetical protein
VVHNSWLQQNRKVPDKQIKVLSFFFNNSSDKSETNIAMDNEMIKTQERTDVADIK